jgi:hypothetical protein
MLSYNDRGDAQDGKRAENDKIAHCQFSCSMPPSFGRGGTMRIVGDGRLLIHVNELSGGLNI